MMEHDEPPILSSGVICCGCSACVAVCPTQCIDMKPDQLGFMRPHLLGKCIGCGKCKKVCPACSFRDKDSVLKVYWAKSVHDDLRVESSSGGVFGELAWYVLSNGGVVYGASFACNCKEVHHIRVDSLSEIDRVMRSKYTQSMVSRDIYKAFLDDVATERPVLYSGTPCQIAAMRNYMECNSILQRNVVLVDVACHGVPSPLLWRKWVEHISNRESYEEIVINFRSKVSGWQNYSVAYNDLTIPFRDDWYMKAFLSNTSIRGSCLKCPAKRSSGSDLTLCDFWGIDDIDASIDDNLGVSGVIVNTETGDSAIRQVSCSLTKAEVTYTQLVLKNNALQNSVTPGVHRIDFLHDLSSGMTIKGLIDKWSFRKSFINRLLHKFHLGKY